MATSQVQGTTAVDVADPGTRSILNINYDTTNIVEMDTTLPTILKTLASCRDILKAHCGPLSGYAMLVNNISAGAQFEPMSFTRDGIRILNTVEFMSPLERQIKELITYVGMRVDSTAKDGTTTSMLFSTLFLHDLLQERANISNLKLSFYQLSMFTKELFSKIRTGLEKYTFDVNKIKELFPSYSSTDAAGVIAGMQALSSSGGNVKLALAMKEIFENSPEECWDFINFLHTQKETGEPYQIDRPEYDNRIRCVSTLEGSFNTAMQSEYEAENVLCFIIPDAIADMDLKTEAFYSWLEKDLPDDKPAMLMATYLPAQVIQLCRNLNQTRKHKISCWQFSPEQQIGNQAYPWELMILCAITGIVPFSLGSQISITEQNYFIAKKLHWHDTYLDFYGIFDDQSSGLHPFYTNPETATPYYKELLDHLLKQLELYKEGHKPDGRMMSVFVEGLNRLVSKHRPTLRLGGPMHEQVANADVAQDVQGAIMSSLKHGFVINSNFSLLWVLNDIITEVMPILQKYTPSDENPTITYTQEGLKEFTKTAYWSIILSAMIKSIHRVLFATYQFDLDENDTAHWTDNYNRALGMLFSLIDRNGLKDIPTMYVNVFNKGKVFDIKPFIEKLKPYTFDSDVSSNDEVLARSYPVLQPISIVDELLKRIEELLIKVIMTNKIIVTGGVMAKDDEVTSDGSSQS